MTTHDFRDFDCYKQLINGPKWWRQAYGDAATIAWEGSDSQINLVYNLIANYDPRPKVKQRVGQEEFNVSPELPELKWLGDLMACVYMPDDRLKETLRFYWEIQLLYCRETGEANPAALMSVEEQRDLVADVLVEDPNESDEDYAVRVLAEREQFAAQLAQLEVEDEITPDEWLHDQKRCAKLAEQMAEAFMTEHIQPRSFMPEPTQVLLAEHSLGRSDGDDTHAKFESLVDQAAS
jgi:hypothetical protein